mmetsp:Transcript_55339/g.61897  ORF Transcript_55339/g.61897 Transcript_55339/m.61897 type:complete len:156 (+) Transcript_55339:213-680(+)
MEILPSLPFVVATVLFAFLVSVSPHCASSLSLDDSFLSSSSSSSLQRQRLQELNEKSLAGIWKLTTNALPYELVDVRSKLDKRFSKQQQQQEEEKNNDDSIDNVEESSASATASATTEPMTDFNDDDASRNNNNKKTISWLLLMLSRTHIWDSYP